MSDKPTLERLDQTPGTDGELAKILRDASTESMPAERAARLQERLLAAQASIGSENAAPKGTTDSVTTQSVTAGATIKIGAVVLLVVGGVVLLQAWPSSAPSNTPTPPPATAAPAVQITPVAHLPAAAPAEPAPAAPATAPIEAAETHEPRVVRRPSREPEHAPQPATQPAQQPALPTELSLVMEARRLLASDPLAALAVTERATTLYGAGSLGQERDVIAIDALVRAGRHDQAQMHAARFFAAYPSSNYTRRVRDLIAPAR